MSCLQETHGQRTGRRPCSPLFVSVSQSLINLHPGAMIQARWEAQTHTALKPSEVKVHGYDEFCKAVSERKGKDIFAYFSGDKDAQGMSWCPDCVEAEPVVRGEMSHLPEGSVFIYCQVGERPYWKDPNNKFKKTLKLSGVPTLIRYGTPQKLVEEECFKADLVRMMFTED
uniref:Thioredoxin domain-containing protein 17 n=1 Tax=Oncorhynchus kisutch TaxID=8019 RepID=A0A8C7KDS9_ONCKI